MARVTFSGVGFDGLKKVVIKKTIDMDDKVARKIFGPEKSRLVQTILKTHCPGISISPHQVDIQIIYNAYSFDPEMGQTVQRL